jgi:hypothetical protein
MHIIADEMPPIPRVALPFKETIADGLKVKPPGKAKSQSEKQAE